MTNQPKKKNVCVCIGGSCGANGGEEVLKKVEEHYGVEAGDSNDVIELEYAGCLGNCDFPVNVEVDDEILMNITPDTILSKIERQQAQSPEENKQKKQEEITKGIEDDFLGFLD